MMPSVEKAAITAELAARLVAAQFPQWADLPVRPVEPGGWDNVTFRLGAGLSVRLPSGPGYAQQVDKEHRWLPLLAPAAAADPAAAGQGRPRVRFPVAVVGLPVAARHPAGQEPCRGPDRSRGRARWLPGRAAAGRSAGGPPPGTHSCNRGGPLSGFDGEVASALKALAGEIDTAAAAQVWREALAAAGPGPPVWVHGDIADGNLLVDHGRLSAVIDFGCCAVGDPACDTVIAWTYFSGASRRMFQAQLPATRATWARGRGWALWKAMIVLVSALQDDPEDARATKRVIAEVLAADPGT